MADVFNQWWLSLCDYLKLGTFSFTAATFVYKGANRKNQFDFIDPCVIWILNHKGSSICKSFL